MTAMPSSMDAAGGSELLLSTGDLAHATGIAGHRRYSPEHVRWLRQGAEALEQAVLDVRHPVPGERDREPVHAGRPAVGARYPGRPPAKMSCFFEVFGTKVLPHVWQVTALPPPPLRVAPLALTDPGGP